MTKAKALLLASMVMVTGCSFIPRYQRPEAPVPPAYPAAGTTNAASATIPWNRFFTDARQQQLIGLALTNNRDLRAAALRVEDAVGAAGGLHLVAALDAVLVLRLAQRVALVHRDGEGGLALVVDPRREVRREAVGEVADVDVEAGRRGLEALDHRRERRHHVGVVRDGGAQLVFGADAGVERAHHVEVNLPHAVGQEQRGEGRHRLVVGADHAHVDGDALALRLQLADIGLVPRDFKQDAGNAAKGSVDFGGLFIGLSMFLIAAALVFAALLFLFTLERRASQIGLLLAIGWTPKNVRRVLLLEAGDLSTRADLTVQLMQFFGHAQTDRPATLQ